MVTTIEGARDRRARRAPSVRPAGSDRPGRAAGSPRTAVRSRGADDPSRAATRAGENRTTSGGRRDGRRLRWDDAGMATAEYAIATVAAAGFAGLLIAILRSDEVRGLLLGIVRGALST